MSKEIETFRKSLERSEHLLFLYDLTADTRTRSVRSDWAKAFKKFMRWPSHNRVMRVDGRDSILILRNPPQGLTKTRFEHDFASELLRSSLVASVSAIDKYFHDITLARCFSLLKGPESRIPRRLRKLELPAVSAFKAVDKVRKDPSSRPGGQLKKALQHRLHKDTYQSSGGVDECMKLIGISDFWKRVSQEMGDGWTPGAIQTELNGIVQRRNQIVHEADIERKISTNRYALQDIKRSKAAKVLGFSRKFVEAANEVISNA